MRLYDLATLLIVIVVMRFLVPVDSSGEKEDINCPAQEICEESVEGKPQGE